MTRVKRPIERKLIGSVRSINTGLRIALAKPRTSAAVRAARKLSTVTPGSRYAEAKMASEEIIQLINIGISFVNSFYISTIIAIFSRLWNFIRLKSFLDLN